MNSSVTDLLMNLWGALAAWALTYADVSLIFEDSWTVLLCQTGQWQDDVH